MIYSISLYVGLCMAGIPGSHQVEVIKIVGLTQTEVSVVNLRDPRWSETVERKSFEDYIRIFNFAPIGCNGDGQH